MKSGTWINKNPPAMLCTIHVQHLFKWRESDIQIVNLCPRFTEKGLHGPSLLDDGPSLRMGLFDTDSDDDE